MKKGIKSLFSIGLVCVLAAALAAPGQALASSEEDESSQISAAAPEDQSLTAALEGTSGVRVATMCTNCNVANVSMCGQSEERVQVWQDGLPVLGGLGAIYLLSVMPPEGVKKTDIVRGAGTVLSGSEAGAGALLIQTRTPLRQKKPYLLASVDFGSLSWQSQKFLGAQRWGRWGAELIATHSRSDGSDPNDDGVNDLAEFERTTVGGSLTFETSRRSHLRLDALSYREDQRDGKGGYGGSLLLLPEDFGNFYEEDIDIRREVYALGWNLDFRDGSRFEIRGRYGRREQDTSDSFTSARPYMWVDEFARIAQARYERILFNRHRLVAGLVHRNFAVDGTTLKTSILFPTGQTLEDRIKQDGAFAEMEFSLPKRFEFTAGVRYDDYDWTPGEGSTLPLGLTIEKRTRSRVSPRLRLAWRATPELSLSLAAGSGFIVPRPIFERVCCGALVLSSANSEPEISENYLLDVDWVPKPWFRLRTSVFRSDFENFLQKIALVTSPYFIPSFAQLNYDEFSLEGIEVSSEMRMIEHLSFGLEATFSRTESDQPLAANSKLFGGPVFTLPDGHIPFYAEDQGSAFIKWDDPIRGWRIFAQANYTGSMYIQEYVAIGIADTFAETPSFATYNLSVRKRVHTYISVFAGVDNITDEYEKWLDDPRYEFNWGQLRGRYYYGGVSFEM
jgi:outer membrane receptor protein involved in Fe transport